MKDNPSETGTASQTPFIFQKTGKINNATLKNRNVLKKESIAEILPFDSAVNKAEAKTFSPINKKQKANKRLPSTAI